MRNSTAIIRNIDELVSAPRKYSNGKIESNIWMLVRYDTSELFETLKLESNIPSKYDLLIINDIMHVISNLDEYDKKGQVAPILIRDVLKIYRDRKES